MATVKEALAHVEGLLRDQGLTVSADPRRLSPPCAWISASRVSHDRDFGGGVVRIDVYLIAPDHGVHEALDHLDDMLTHTLRAVTPSADTIVNETVNLPTEDRAMPAFRVSVDHRVF